MNGFLNWLLATVHDVDPVLRLVIAASAMFFETSILLGLLVPGDTVVLVAGTAVRGPVEFISLVIAVIVGSLAGETLGFTIGHFFGPRFRRTRAGQLVGEKNWVRAETYLERRGGIAVAVSRFLPVFHALVPLVVGTSPMRYRTFIAWTAPVCTVWALLYVSIGTLAAGSYRQLERQINGAGYILIAIIVVALVVMFFIRRALQRNEAKHMDATSAE
jgi:membrane-associated protein